MADQRSLDNLRSDLERLTAERDVTERELLDNRRRYEVEHQRGDVLRLIHGRVRTLVRRWREMDPAASLDVGEVVAEVEDALDAPTVAGTRASRSWSLPDETVTRLVGARTGATYYRVADGWKRDDDEPEFAGESFGEILDDEESLSDATPTPASAPDDPTRTDSDRLWNAVSEADREGYRFMARAGLEAAWPILAPQIQQAYERGRAVGLLEFAEATLDSMEDDDAR